MTMELPVFRLGLAGFSAVQQEELAAALRRRRPAALRPLWEIGELDGADAWWMNGARVRALGNDRLRVGPGRPSDRSLQLHLPDVERPLAFAEPLSCHYFPPLHSFEAASQASIDAVLDKFETWLSAVAAQFWLASHIVEHHTVLGSDVFEVSVQGRLLAVVDLYGETGVLPSAGPSEFDAATWRRAPGGEIPEQFVRASLPQLMWQYAERTRRDLLPKHYRTCMLYFRRPPPVPQRLLKDAHLLLVRELAHAPSSFEFLRQRTGLPETVLTRALASLYMVGTITSNPRRAVVQQRPHREGEPEAMPAQSPYSSLTLDSMPAAESGQAAASDATAPAQLRPN